jgi:isoquinoline 1-oxidoreductase subunit alpha
MDLEINAKQVGIPSLWEPETLLSFLRENMGLVGAKFGCGVGLCGACTVIVDGVAQRSCLASVSSFAGKSITTIEGLANQKELHPVWLLPVGSNHEHGCIAESCSEANRRPNRRSAAR